MADQYGTYKYITPLADIPLEKRDPWLKNVISASMARAIQSKAVISEGTAHVRTVEPVTDFGMAAGGWLAPAFGVIGTAVTVFNGVATPQLANNRFVVFYGCFIEAIPCPANLLIFREGAVGGSTYGMFEMSELAARNETVGWFSEPIWYEPQAVMLVQWTPRVVVAAGARMGLLGFTIERKGTTVSG
jgi:hypothetical protein